MLCGGTTPCGAPVCSGLCSPRGSPFASAERWYRRTRPPSTGTPGSATSKSRRRLLLRPEARRCTSSGAQPLTNDAEDGARTPMLMARSGHTSVRSLARYARVSAAAREVGRVIGRVWRVREVPEYGNPRAARLGGCRRWDSPAAAPPACQGLLTSCIRGTGPATTGQRPDFGVTNFLPGIVAGRDMFTLRPSRQGQP